LIGKPLSTRFLAELEIQRLGHPSHLAMTINSALLRAILLLAIVGAPFRVQAQTVLRPEVAKLLQVAQSQIKSGNPSDAAIQARSAMSLPDLTSQERAMIEQVLATAAIHAKDYKTAIGSLTYLSSDTSVLAAERLAYQETLIHLLRVQGDVVGLTPVARAYLDQGGVQVGIRALYLQALSIQNRHQDVLDYLSPALNATQPVRWSEPELKVLAVAQKSINNPAGYYDALKRLVGVAPAQPEYWRELLHQLRKQPFFNTRYELDVARIMAHRRLLKDADEYLDYANLALKFGYPLEARLVLHIGGDAKAFGLEQDSVRYQKLLDLVNRKIEEDAKQVRVLEASIEAQDQAELAEVLFSKAQYKTAIPVYSRALQTPNHRREAELRLHFLIALKNSGMGAEALQQLDGLRADATALELGQLWISMN
jgi:tetratricopeptide (TPR) repeat protein